MKKHYETHVEDTDKLISVAGPELDYKSWYEQYRKLMEEQAQRKYGLYTPTSEGDDDDFPSIPGMIARYSASGLTNEQMAANPVWVDKTGNGHDIQMKNFAWSGMSGAGGIDRAIYFYNGYKVSSNIVKGNFTIEVLPLYPGALVFDGVDDYGVCDNFPILTKEKGYTVVALRQWIEEKNDSTALVSNCKNWGQDGAFLFEYNNLRINFLNIAISFGRVSSVDRGKSPFSYQTSKLYNGKNIEPGSFIGSNELVVGKGNKDFPNVSKVAIWELIILDHDATEEELTKIKNYFVKTYPWLFFDQAWTVTGKTNEDEGRTTIANITGNGNDLVLSNFGFIEGSGYNEEGEYAGYLVTDGVDDKAVSKQFKFGENFTVILDFKFPVKKISYCGFDLSSKVRIQNLQGSGVYVVLKGNKTLIPSNVVRAVTSEGKVYDENWNEYNIVPGNISSNYTMVNLGFDGSNQFAESATKLAGIYSSALSKDDCIKAYNYLQTLKSK